MIGGRLGLGGTGWIAQMGTPCAACCNTAVICSTEKRFFTALLLVLAGPIVPQSHPGNGLKNPEPLSIRGECHFECHCAGKNPQTDANRREPAIESANGKLLAWFEFGRKSPRLLGILEITSKTPTLPPHSHCSIFLGLLAFSRESISLHQSLIAEAIVGVFSFSGKKLG
jgi:hypothetical protein